MFGVEDTRPKSKLSKTLKEYKARRAAALAPVKEKIDQIQSLIDEGKNREAYRIFEELPLADQLAVSLAPGVGDALAVFETKEFGTRGGERFEEDDVLGGLGNYLLSGLSGLSTIPFFGAVADVAKIGAKGIGRVARTADDMGGGPSSVKIDDPRANEYAGTRPEIYKSNFEDMAYEKYAETLGSGLSSPSRKFVQNLDQNKPVKVEKLIADIRNNYPRSEGELRLLKVIDENKNLTQEFKDYFKALPEYSEGKIPPRALDAYLAINQVDAINIPKVSREIFEGKGVRDINRDLETQRVYRIDGLEGSKRRPGEHFNEIYDDVLVFDSTDVKIASDGAELNVNRVQSDFVEDLGQVSDKRKIDGQRQSPYLSDGKEDLLKPPTVDVIEKKLAADLDKTNKLAKEINELKYSRFDDTFSADMSPKLAADIDPKSISTRLTKEEGTKLNLLELDHQSASDALEKKIKELAPDKAIADTELREIAAGKLSEFVMPTGLENIFKFLKDRTKMLEDSSGKSNPFRFDAPAYARIGEALDPNLLDPTFGLPYDNFKFKFSPEFFTSIKSDPLSLTVKGEKTLDDIINKLNQSTIKSNEAINLRNQELYLKDPYATGISTNPDILPTRHLINEAAQTPDIDYLTFRPQEILEKEGGINMKKNHAHYHQIAKETERVLKELDVPKDSLVYKKTTREFLNKETDKIEEVLVPELIRIDLEPIRQAIKEGKTINAFKDGGSANIDRLLNNL